MSRDGNRVVYAHSRSTWRLMRTDLRTLASTPILESRTPIALPVVSYDGRTVAFFTELASGVHVFTIDVDGANLRQRTFDDGGMNTLPAWAHDGSLYYYRERSLYKLPALEGRGIEVLPDFHWSSRNFLAVHVDKIAYHEFPAPGRRGVIKDLVAGRETTIPTPVVRPMQWSKDGSALLGFRDDAALVVCDAIGADCETLANDEGPIRGGRPRWSLDEARIFFRRAADRPLYSVLWAVDRDGKNVTRLFEFGPFEPDNVYYGVAADDTIIWNQLEQTPSEIWMSDVN
jgi:Tol biopolymer transport system component